jgi:pyridoxal 5'-phosphate synthase pdxS subunit
LRKESGVSREKASYELKVTLGEMLRGGVIFDVTSPHSARIAEDGGAVAVVALEEGNEGRMASPETIQKIQEAVSIPVIARCRIGHFVEAEVLEALFLDFIDESELLVPVDCENQIDKHQFRIPFICGCATLGDALRRIQEGAALLRTLPSDLKGTVSQIRRLMGQLKSLKHMDRQELMAEANRLMAPYSLVEQLAQSGTLPVPFFAFGGVETPADVALLMRLGVSSVFLNHKVFEEKEALKKVKALTGAVHHHKESEMLVDLSSGILEKNLEVQELKQQELLSQKREW